LGLSQTSRGTILQDSLGDADARLPHRLSVVWFTDLVGYSSLAARDEDRAIALVRRFHAAVRAVVPPESGRIVKFLGDAAMVESPSAESALLSAAALRESMGEGEAIRTGIHLCDVAVATDGDLYGDGVNTAQRLQTEAEPGQIVVSENVARGLRSRPAFRFESLGERHLKGLAPLEVFLFVDVEGSGDGDASDDRPKARSRAGTASPTTGGRSIAVLPFTNLSPDPENEYFSDGVTEEILTALTKLGHLKVISRTSVMQYKGTTKSVRQIGRELDVGAVLEGSVRRAGQRVRITAQLIESETDTHLWAENYDRDLDDIFAIQTDVAEPIVEALRVQLSPREKARIAERPTESVEAYQWYLKGRFFLARRTEHALERSIQGFRKALAGDPSFALAWVGLADAYALLPLYSDSPIEEAVAEARAAAGRALALDPALGEAHAALGLIADQLWEWDEADREHRKGIALNPGYATGHHWYGVSLIYSGRLDEAIDTLRRALELDPLSLPIHGGLLTAYAYARRYKEAVEIGQKVIEMDPAYPSVRNNLAETYDLMGRFEEALEQWDALAALTPERFPRELSAALRAGYVEAGPRGYWRAWVEHGKLFKGYSGPIGVARGHAQLGEFDEAFSILGEVVSGHGARVHQVIQDPVFDPLRSDPRFGELLRKIGVQ
jgi:TolB-like protein/cytochrome c-type biogenesis protein CcmH/NrfG